MTSLRQMAKEAGDFALDFVPFIGTYRLGKDSYLLYKDGHWEWGSVVAVLTASSLVFDILTITGAGVVGKLTVGKGVSEAGKAIAKKALEEGVEAGTKKIVAEKSLLALSPKFVEFYKKLTYPVSYDFIKELNKVAKTPKDKIIARIYKVAAVPPMIATHPIETGKKILKLIMGSSVESEFIEYSRKYCLSGGFTSKVVGYAVPGPRQKPSLVKQSPQSSNEKGKKEEQPSPKPQGISDLERGYTEDERIYQDIKSILIGAGVSEKEFDEKLSEVMKNPTTKEALKKYLQFKDKNAQLFSIKATLGIE
ncbi:MAG: hypothetical protein QW035_00690 [Candidatus Anstonellales archaeon]